MLSRSVNSLLINPADKFKKELDKSINKRHILNVGNKIQDKKINREFVKFRSMPIKSHFTSFSLILGHLQIVAGNIPSPEKIHPAVMENCDW